MRPVPDHVLMDALFSCISAAEVQRTVAVGNKDEWRAGFSFAFRKVVGVDIYVHEPSRRGPSTDTLQSRLTNTPTSARSRAG